MEQVLLVIHVIIAAALIGMVLLQRSDTDGFGLGSGSNSNLLSGRAAANLMTRTTAILAALFIANSLLLSVLAAHHGRGSIVDTIEQTQTDASDKSDKDADTDAMVTEKKGADAKADKKPSVPEAGVEKPKAVKKHAAPREPSESGDEN